MAYFATYSGVALFVLNDPWATLLNSVSTGPGHSAEILTLLSGIIIGFLVLQCAINFILILFKMFAQNHRFRKILLGLVLSILFIISSYFVGYVMGTYFKIVDFDFQENLLLLWIPLGIYTIFGILFYVISCILYEKKVNI